MAALVILLPVLGAVAALVLGRRRPVEYVSVGATAAATVLAAVQLRESSEPTLGTVVTGGPAITLSLLLDRTAVVVALLVCLVALLVQIYSTGYLAAGHGPGRDPGRRYPS